MTINIPVKHNKKLKKILDHVNNHIELQTHLKSSNVMAVDRFTINDHGPVHVAIVANIALKLLRNLVESGVELNIVKDYESLSFSKEDGEIIVFLASILHDIGHIVHRKNHEQYSIPLAISIIKDILSPVYAEEKRYVMLGDILHAIISHDTDYRAGTVEAGVVRIADALDMKEGRARIPFDAGSVNIHSVSALAIKDVMIKKSKKYPIMIEILMKNSAGIYQIENLLQKKIHASLLEKYVHVVARIESEKEEKIITKWEMG